MDQKIEDAQVTGRIEIQLPDRKDLLEISTVEVEVNGNTKKQIKFWGRTWTKRKEMISRLPFGSKLAEIFPRLSNIFLKEVMSQELTKNEKVAVDSSQIAIYQNLSQAQLPRITPVS